MLKAFTKHTTFFGSFILLFSFIYLLPGISSGLNIYDEGISVYGAVRVLSGEVPYRDFWTLYSPGQFYVLGALFTVFGPSIIVERLWDILVRSLLALVVYVIARSLTSQRAALIAWFVAVSWLGYFGFYSYSVFPALLCSLLSALSIFKSLSKGESQRPLWLIIGGVLTGMTTLFRHDLGFYTFVAQLSVAAIFVFGNLIQNKRSGSWGTLRSFRDTRFTLSYFLIGVAIALLPPLVYFANVVPLYDLVYDLVIFPTTIFPKVRWLPYPAPFPNPQRILSGELSILSYLRLVLGGIPFYFPFLVYALAAITVVNRIRRRAHNSQTWLWAVTLLTLLGLASFNQAIVRSDLIHLVPTFVPAIVLLSMLFHEHTTNIAKKRFLIYSVAFVILSAILIEPIYSRTKALYESYPLLTTVSHELDRARYVHVNPDQTRAINYIQSHVPEGERIYVGNSTHDRIFVNDVMFYFLAERNSATKYHELHPGLATTLPIQRRIVEDLIRNRVRYIVLLSAFQNVKEPNESAISSGVTLLDQFIQDNYYLVEQFGDYTVWKKH